MAVKAMALALPLPPNGRGHVWPRDVSCFGFGERYYIRYYDGTEEVMTDLDALLEGVGFAMSISSTVGQAWEATVTAAIDHSQHPPIVTNDLRLYRIATVGGLPPLSNTERIALIAALHAQVVHYSLFGEWDLERLYKGKKHG